MRNKITTTTKKNPVNQLSIIIPAAGLGKRMKAFGPKALIEVRGRTIIERQLELIGQAYPQAEIIVVAGFMGDKLMNALPTTILKVENENYEQTNVVRSIGIGLRVARSEMVGIIMGDLVFNHAALPQIQESTLIVDKGGLMHSEEVGITIQDGRAEILMYDLNPKWAQIGFFTGLELKLLKQFCWNPDKYNLFGFEAINEGILKKGKFKAVGPEGIKIVDVDSVKDLEIAEKI